MMARDLDPVLEDAARRRLSELADAFAVPPAAAEAATDAASDHRLIARDPGGGPVPDGAPVPSGTAGLRHAAPRRRRPLVAAAVTVALAAAATGMAVAVAGDDEPEPRAGTVTDDCAPRVAEDGVIGRGTTPGGDEWSVRVQGAPPAERTTVLLNGQRAGETWGDEDSWATIVSAGMLPLHVEVTEDGLLVHGQIPRETSVVEVRADQGGGDEAVAHACPVTVPSNDLLGFFVMTLPPGTSPTEARALDDEGRALATADLSVLNLDVVPSGAGTTMNVDPDLVPLPLGGLDVELPPSPVLTPILSGELPSGRRWSVSSGWMDDFVNLMFNEYDGGPGGGFGAEPGQMAEHPDWSIEKVEGRLVVWGSAPPEMASIQVTLSDGTTVDADTVRAVPDADIRAFAVALPDGATATAIEGLGADGSAVLQAEDVPGRMRRLAGPDGADSVRLTVVPAR